MGRQSSRNPGEYLCTAHGRKALDKLAVQPTANKIRGPASFLKYRTVGQLLKVSGGCRVERACAGAQQPGLDTPHDDRRAKAKARLS